MSEQRTREAKTSSRTSAPAADGKKRVRGAEDAAERACESLNRLINHHTEGVSAVSRTDKGWQVDVDVLELSRIPDTTSLLATYAVDLDEGGSLVQYHRVRRYRRGQADT
ncbi:gas vesicle protein [Streptomyces sp. NPDC059398]|uniref:gas vesicle protein GvpO n=1 Tax=Streptomyces sp. NPDC059398 TaxID=3346820 RepID=UPI0036BEEEB7